MRFPDRLLVIAARQEVTREIWPLLYDKFDLHISALVIQEASQGDNEAANKRPTSLSGIPVLEITERTRSVAQSLLNENAIPSTFKEDALHITVAGVNGMDLLRT